MIVVTAARPTHADPLPAFELPPVAAPEPRTIVEEADGPVYYRRSPELVSALERIAIGEGFRSSGHAFELDALGGADVRLGRASAVRISIEAGYSYARFHDHFGVLGAGPAWTSGDLRIALILHAVVGSHDDAFGYGVRTSALATWSGLGIEVANDYIVVGTERVQEIRVMLTSASLSGAR